MQCSRAGTLGATPRDCDGCCGVRPYIDTLKCAGLLPIGHSLFCRNACLVTVRFITHRLESIVLSNHVACTSDVLVSMLLCALEGSCLLPRDCSTQPVTSVRQPSISLPCQTGACLVLLQKHGLLWQVWDAVRATQHHIWRQAVTIPTHKGFNEAPQLSSIQTVCFF